MEIALQRDSAVHLFELLGDHLRQPLHQGLSGLRRGQEFLQTTEPSLGLRFGGVERRKINFVATEQEAALAGFRVLYRASQFDCCRAGVPQTKRVVEIRLRAFAEPDGGADDRKQRQKSHRERDNGEIDDKSTGNRHGLRPNQITHHSSTKRRAYGRF